MNENLHKRIKELIKEEIVLVPYDSDWPNQFIREEKYLRKILPDSIIKRIEHFGSTAIPNISAKPIIDMLVEVTSLTQTKNVIVPLLTRKEYEYLWRPIIGNDPPCYAWFIKRDNLGNRTHHIHMVEGDSILWDRIYFRDYLRKFPHEAYHYDRLKQILCNKYSHDRVAYTKGKSSYIQKITEKAIKYYQKK